MEKKCQIVHTMNTQDNIWIGLAQVSSRPSNDLLGGSKGAYVNVLAIAINPADFIAKVKRAIIDLDLDPVHIEDIEPLSERRKNYEISRSILMLAHEVSETRGIRFGDFHTFDI
jgi:hypothetical protein